MAWYLFSAWRGAALSGVNGIMKEANCVGIKARGCFIRRIRGAEIAREAKPKRDSHLLAS